MVRSNSHQPRPARFRQRRLTHSAFPITHRDRMEPAGRTPPTADEMVCRTRVACSVTGCRRWNGHPDALPGRRFPARAGRTLRLARWSSRRRLPRSLPRRRCHHQRRIVRRPMLRSVAVASRLTPTNKTEISVHRRLRLANLIDCGPDLSQRWNGVTTRLECHPFTTADEMTRHPPPLTRQSAGGDKTSTSRPASRRISPFASSSRSGQPSISRVSRKSKTTQTASDSASPCSITCDLPEESCNCPALSWAPQKRHRLTRCRFHWC